MTYLACQAVKLPPPLTPIAAWRRIVAQALPGFGLAMRIRDAISARSGVARIGGFSVVQVANPKPGGQLDFFLIEHLAPDGMICITTSGITHRWLGRVYMWPVGSAHRLIVWLMLRRLRRSMN